MAEAKGTRAGDDLMRRLLGPAFLILVASLLAACRDGEAGLTPAGRNRSVIASAPLEIVGHRGAKGITPENTLASFQKALDLGVDMIELDVHLSKDGELVVIHDPNLERTTNGSGLVGDYTLEQPSPPVPGCAGDIRHARLKNDGAIGVSVLSLCSSPP